LSGSGIPKIRSGNSIGLRVNPLARLKPLAPSILTTLPSMAVGLNAHFDPIHADIIPGTVELTLLAYVSMVDDGLAPKVEALIQSKMHFAVIGEFLRQALNDEITREDVEDIFGIGTVRIKSGAKFSENPIVWDVAALYYFETQDLDNAILFAGKCYENFKAPSKLDPVSKIWKSHYAGILGMSYLQKARELMDAKGSRAEINQLLHKAQIYYEVDLECKPDAIKDYGHYWESLYRQGKASHVFRSVRRAFNYYKDKAPAGVYFYAWRILMNMVL